MEKLKHMKECLVGMVEGQIYGNIDKVDAQELGAAVDMIKDLSEAVYYCTITKAMEEEEKTTEKGKHGIMYSTPTYRTYPYPIEMYDPRYRERYGNDMMYSRGQGNGSYNPNGIQYSHEGIINSTTKDDMSAPQRDPMEGKSGRRRKKYMDGKHGVHDKGKQLQELEAYMQDLTSDLTEMIQDASPEERSLLQTKINILASKIK